MLTTDFVIVGGGIAGVSVGAELASAGHKVILLELESHLGMHASGRSAALFLASYGNRPVRALSAASRDFLTTSDNWWEGLIVRHRGALCVATVDQDERLRSFVASRLDEQPYLEIVDGEEARWFVPILRADYVSSCVYDHDAFDIDVDALLQGYARKFRAAGGQIWTDCELIGASADNGAWSVLTSRGEISCGAVINTAGAWADEVAEKCGVRPIGLQPYRRTAFLVPAPEGLEIDRWPLVFDIDEQFYFKPDAGLILVSPANEDPSPPCDASPEEIEVATGAYHVEEATSLPIRTIKSKWAGLRTFLPDRTPVVGEDPGSPGFFWCAGQGGYGVQMAPALARCAAACALGDRWPQDVHELGVAEEALSPARLALFETCGG